MVGLFNKITGRGQTKIQILRDFEGVIKSGELLVVLGKPGSGCSTLLKTISGETHGFYIGEGSNINYQGTLAPFSHRRSDREWTNTSPQESRKSFPT